MYRLPFEFFIGLVRQRDLLISMTKRDINNRYMGSFLGGGWALIQPLVTILVMWFVFQFGFRAGNTTDGIPFALWLISGMIPWFFFSEALSTSTNAIVEQAHIVKKIVFRISLLPVVKILASLMVHFFFIFVLVIVSLIHGYMPTLKWLQIPYYLFSAMFLLLALSWTTSSVIVFFRDFGQLVAVCIQLGFWATPIFWNIAMIPEKYQWIFNLNPVFYFIEGYRESIIDGAWFWENPAWTLYFWAVNLLLMLVGVTCFKRLKPHFADVL